eukprot:TRINITY_DN9016_c0_g1_i4.p2 TRINITY_DN9016_c0_g1~~TRINITY_DN9016_c0_g1_i4.p2  ORF type:complete len:243 (-),score=20.93 TRINITY_DN9016_c0_g1_i4:828-1556(-)
MASSITIFWITAWMLFAATNSIPVIWDDDGSQDSLQALILMLNTPNIDLKAMIISQGLAKPQEFTPLFMRFLATIGEVGIPVAIGPEYPLEGNNSFPESFRQGNQPDFFKPFVSIVDEPLEVPYLGTGEELIIKTLQDAVEPVTYFLSGGHTTLANVIEMEPDLVQDKIEVIYCMGGAVLVEGNLFESPNPALHNNTLHIPKCLNGIFGLTQLRRISSSRQASPLHWFRWMQLIKLVYHTMI